MHFIDRIADPEQAPYFNSSVLQRFRGFGGVRLEDVILVLDDGVENLTLCPRTVTEIEEVMAGGQWPPVADQAPELRRKWSTLSSDGSMTNIDL
jgi:Xaa-Pro dipeptidase